MIATRRPTVAAANYSENDSDIDLAALSEEDFELGSDAGLAAAKELTFEEQRRALDSGRHHRNLPTRVNNASASTSSIHEPTASEASRKRKRDNKHAPMEVSSKKPVSRAREAVKTVICERRDPRFDQKGLPIMYLKRPRSVTNEMRILQASIRKEKDPLAKAKLEKTLSSMQSKLQAVQEHDRRQKVVSRHNGQQREAAKTGKTPYFLKEADKQALYLKDKFENMKDSASLSTYLQKKRKRRSQKDRRQLG